MKFGYVALVGRPNVGKSTLMNRFLGKKLSITSRKPQTTRQRIVGIKTVDEVQIVFVDTPGIHNAGKHALNKYMNKAALSTLTDVDLILFMVDAGTWTEEDAWVLKQLKKVTLPVILVVNKIDLLSRYDELLPYIEARSSGYEYRDIMPISAEKGENLDKLEEKIISFLPEETHHYDPEQFTDRSDRFIAAEIVREKLMRMLGQELPYASAATIDAFEESDKIIKIAATIWVEREGQKAIVIGDKGNKLKAVGTKARIDMETYFEKKVFLQLWVKVKSNWSDDQRSLNQFGYADE